MFDIKPSFLLLLSFFMLLGCTDINTNESIQSIISESEAKQPVLDNHHVTNETTDILFS